jgi:hypothetical protein
MAILKPILKPVFGPTITFILFRQRSGSAGGGPPPPPDPNTYIQSDNTNFFQPDGSSLYLIP